MEQIENCSWKFAFQCPMAWSRLRQTDDPNVRLCESCLENVYLCRNEGEVTARAKEGKCVAIRFSRGLELLGKVVPKTNVQKQ